MANIDEIDILLAEDNPMDAELMISVLKKSNISNPLHWVKNGQEALCFLFCEGTYADRKVMKPPKLIILDIKMPQSHWHRSTAEH